MLWAVAEGGAKTAEHILKKFIAGEGGSFVVLATGAVQAFGGFLGVVSRSAQFVPSYTQVFWSLLFGILASFNSALSVWAYAYEGADIGVITFLITLSIIPGAFIDWIFFAHPLNIRQWCGIVIFLLAGWFALNFPSLQLLLSLPVWALFGVAIALMLAVCEAISQANCSMNPLLNNFWVGISTIVCWSLVIWFTEPWGTIRYFSPSWFIGSFAVGLVIFGMIFFKIMSYKGGGTIALKKIIMQGARLVSAMIFGTLIYHESMTVGKISAFALFFVAFILTDKNTYEFLFKRQRVTPS